MMKNYQQKTPGDPPKDRKLKAPSVTAYMTTELITFSKETPMREVIDTMLNNRISGAPVLNEKREVVGLIDDKDCLKLLFGGAYYNHPVGRETVERYMGNVMKFISVNDDIMNVADIFMQTKYKRLVVMDETGKLAGQISRRDILRAIKDLKTNTW
jgi:CBS domain-containing protein